jgi:hypothetical protein
VGAAEVPVPRVVVEALVEEFGRTLPGSLILDLERALAGPDVGEVVEEEIVSIETLSSSSPPWSLVRPAEAHLRRLVADRGPGGLAELDQLRAVLRNALDEVEVTLHDEWAVYFGLVWTGAITELARNGFENERLTPAAYRDVAEITTTIGAALIDYVPRSSSNG